MDTRTKQCDDRTSVNKMIEPADDDDGLLIHEHQQAGEHGDTLSHGWAKQAGGQGAK